MTDSLDLLVSRGMMTADQAVAARKIDGADVLERASRASGIPAGELFVELIRATTGLDATADLISERTDPETTMVLSRDRAEAWGVIPLRHEGQNLVVAATADAATNPITRQNLAGVLNGQPITWLIARTPEVAAKISATYRNEGEIGELAATAVDGSTSNALDARARMVDLYIAQAINDRASDIHFEPGPTAMSVRFRIDGVLVDRPRIPAEAAMSIVSRIKTMADLDIDRRHPHDGNIKFAHGTRHIDMRVSTIPTIYGEKVVLRILDNDTRLDLSSFGMNTQVNARWRDGFTRPHGMLLVTGPTGTGKSTTLYATIAEIATRDRNVITVEDPVETRLPGVNQIQVNTEIGFTFAAALRSILRQDPDVILVGEIRDHETATVAIEAALTGHLVLSTLHTNSAPEASVRLVEMGIEPFLVASVVECALAQRLVRRLCESCRIRVQPTQADLESIGFSVPDGTPTSFFEASTEGCARCTGGYQGRLAIYEAAHKTAAMEQFIVSGGVSSPAAKAAAAADGMFTLRQDGWLKVAQGLTTASEILRVTV